MATSHHLLSIALDRNNINTVYQWYDLVVVAMATPITTTFLLGNMKLKYIWLLRTLLNGFGFNSLCMMFTSCFDN